MSVSRDGPGTGTQKIGMPLMSVRLMDGSPNFPSHAIVDNSLSRVASLFIATTRSHAHEHGRVLGKPYQSTDHVLRGRQQ